MRTLHLGIRVSDLERSLAFYTGLGYEVVGTVPETELGRLTMLKLPGDEFVTIELVDEAGRGRVGPGGLSHVVLQVESMHDTVAELAERGVHVEAPGSPDGTSDFWTTWLTDPDGYRIELVQWPVGHPVGMTDADLPDEVDRSAWSDQADRGGPGAHGGPDHQGGPGEKIEPREQSEPG